MVYIPSNENHCNNLEGKVEERVPGQWWTGVAIPDFHFSVDTKAGFYGELQAYDVDNGKRAWRDLYSNSMNWGSVLTTAGGLLFAGGTNDRQFRAYDAKTGEELWHFRTNSGVIAPPSTFEVNGVQYIAVAVRLRCRCRRSSSNYGRAGWLESGCAAGRGCLGVRCSSERRRAAAVLGRRSASRQNWRLAVAQMTVTHL